MKTTKAIQGILKVIVVVILSVCIFSCEGEDGAVGPQGEQGLQGEQGEQGSAGQDGADGQNGEAGTANVIYSDWIDSGFPLPPVNSSEVFFSIDAIEITEEIINSGVVLVYGRGQSGILPLPSIYDRINYSYFLRNATSDQLIITVSNLESGSINVVEFRSYRYVIIPGGMSIDKNASDIDYTKMSYKEIATLFNIPE